MPMINHSDDGPRRHARGDALSDAERLPLA